MWEATMNPGDDGTDLADRGLITEHCDRFRDEWLAGRRPSVEEYLAQVAESDRQLLLRRLIAIEVELRRIRGEQPTPAEYHERFPDHAALVDATFAADASPRQTEHSEGRPPHRSDPDTARNLLLGILALQHNFVDRAALLSAFNTWIEDKTRSLGTILVEQGRLAESRHAILNALVAEHLELNGGDPDRSLAALNPPGPVRRDLEHLADADLAASLGHVGTCRTMTGDPDATVNWAGAPMSDGAGFTVVRLHARGGLGEVFAATDEELHREVALKRIQEPHADNADSRARFLQEAEITGGLEHPGIVPVYRLGHYENGRPFYAMRLVKGEDLRTAVMKFHDADRDPKRDPGERTVSLRRLLGRFLDVCNAVAYAHSRGVLHRDLKPANILLGKYGETLIIDWGLAKVVGRADPGPADAEPTLRPPSGSAVESTRAGAAIGTPGFMSPEQARGDIDGLGPASDVFSLGATLYFLITGRQPFAAEDFAERLRKNERCEFPAPHIVKSDISRPLQAVCLKAMAPEPGDRYPSPRALAEDIEHWLADEPVSALPDSWSHRAARWTRRHRAATQAAAAALLLVTTVSLAAVFLIDRARRGESLALASETKAKLREIEQRKRAEEGEQLAVDAVKKFRDVVANNPEFEYREELLPLRRALLKEPLEFFRRLRDRFQSSRDTNPEALSRLASASHELASTSLLFDNTSTDVVGIYKDAVAIQERLAREHPDSVKFQSELARGLTALGGQTRGESLRKAAQIWERLAREHPDVLEFQKQLAATLLSEASLWVESNISKAYASIEAARSIYERLGAERPESSDLRLELAELHATAATYWDYKNDRAATIDSYQKSLAIYEQLAKADPENLRILYPMLSAYNLLGREWVRCGKPAQALETYQSARSMLERLELKYPTRIHILQRTLNINVSIASLQKTSDRAASLAAVQTAASAGEKLWKINPNILINLEAGRDYATMRSIFFQEGRPAAAEEARRRAVEIFGRLAGESWNDNEPRIERAEFCNLVGNDLRWAGERVRSLELVREGLAIADRLARDRPDDARIRHQIAFSHMCIGDILRWTGRPAEAIESYRKAIPSWEWVVREQPDERGPANLLFAAREGLGCAYLAFGRPARAREVLREAIAYQRQLVAKNLYDVFHQLYLREGLVALRNAASALDDLPTAAEAAREYVRLVADNPGELLTTASSLIPLLSRAKSPSERDRYADEAIRIFQEARSVFERQSQQQPENHGLAANMIRTHVSIGDLLDLKGRGGEALSSYRTARTIGERLAQDRPSSAEVAGALGLSLHQIARLEARRDKLAARDTMRQAIMQTQRALKMDPGNWAYQSGLNNHLVSLGQIAPAQGVPAEVPEAAHQVAPRIASDPGSLYNMACILSRCLPLARDAAERDRYAGEALEALRAAIKMGWSKAAWTDRDPDFVPLHVRPEFGRIVAELFDRGFPADPLVR
jgi:serine/threonine-protein kinase